MDVICANDVLEALRAEAVDGFNRLSHGGLETGGILFGRQTERSVEILRSKPLDCEHRNGPSFILSERDEASLQAALADPDFAALQPIGLYISHSRRGFALAEADRRILDRYFPKPWQMALLLMPSKLGATRAGFFIRSSDDESGYICANTLSLYAPERHESAGEPEHPTTRNMPGNGEEFPARLAAFAGGVGGTVKVDDREVSELEVIGSFAEEIQPKQLAGIAISRAPNGTDPVTTHNTLAIESFRSVLALPENKRRLNWRKWITAAAFVILCAGVGGRLWTRSKQDPLPPLPLKISDVGANIQITWDPALESVRAGTAATLEIHDGHREPLYLPIAREVLTSGSIVYTPRSENIDLRLRVVRGNDVLSESSLYFIVNPVLSTPPPAFPPTNAAAPGPSAAAPAQPAAAPTPQPASPVVSDSLPKQKLTAAVEARAPMPEPVSRRIATRTFNPPAKRLPSSSDVATRESLIDLPNIHATPSDSAVLLPSAPPIGVPPPPALLERQNRAPAPPQPRSGRLIWTGDLRKNGLLALTSAGASLGVLNGRLPGFPVKVTVQPAELVAGGIAIYSSDRTKSGTSEPPSAHNGWNVVVYDWDPKRIAELNVVEAPGPANDWKRLVLRNGNRNVSVLVVEWQRASGQ